MFQANWYLVREGVQNAKLLKLAVRETGQAARVRMSTHRGLWTRACIPCMTAANRTHQLQTSAAVSC